MASQPKTLNPPARSPFRLDRIAAIIETKLESEPMLLDVLVTATAKGNAEPGLWALLHEAAIRDNRVVELSTAYEQLIGSPKLKFLSGAAQADVLTHAASFFEDVVGDPAKASPYLERALAASPAHAEAYSRLENLLAARQDTRGLIDLYASTAARRPGADDQLSLLRRAAELAESIPDGTDQAVRLYQQIVRLDPSDTNAVEAVEAHYVRAGRFRDAAKWLEQVLSAQTRVDEIIEVSLRDKLLRIYRDELGDLDRAFPHAEKLLVYDPAHDDARAVAGQLLEHTSLGQRAVTALIDSFEKLNEFGEAASMVARQLEVARGPRRIELQKRLAALRQDRLADDAGAMELLEVLIIGEIADADVRRRFRQAAVALDRHAEAQRTIVDAVVNSNDPVLRLRVEAELAQFSLEAGDHEGAERAFEAIMRATTDDAALLTAAKGLASLYGPGRGESLAIALGVVARLEPDDGARWAASLRLAKLYQDELADAPKAMATWTTLVGTPLQTPALDALEKLYESHGLHRELANILELRSKSESNPSRARALAFRGADLRTSRLENLDVVLEVWRDFLRAHGPWHEAHAKIIPLLEQEERWTELAEVLATDAELATGADKIAVLRKLATVAFEHLKDPGAAIASFAKVLALDPEDGASRGSLEGLLGREEHRIAAADVLEPIYRAEGNARGLLLILRARAASTADTAIRLRILDEAATLLDRDLGETAEALGVAGGALREAVAHELAAIEPWVNRVQELSAKGDDPSALAAILARALGERGVDDPHLFALACRTGDALLAAGESAAALAVLRRAIAFDSTSPELVERVSALILQQGSAAERVSIYRLSLDRTPDKARRRDMIHQIARIEHSELGDTAAAIATWQTAVAEDRDDVVAEEALLAAYAALGDYKALYEELARGLSGAQGERRITVLLKMAEAAAKSGQAEQALLHYRELLAESDLSDEVLTLVERAADAVSDAETLAAVLERKVATVTDVEKRILYLERLGDLHAERLGNMAAALASWKRAARLSDETAAPAARRRELYAKVTAADPADRQASERLVELYVDGGDLRQLASVYSNLLRSAKDERQALNLIAAMEPWAVRAGASREFGEAVDMTVARYFGAASLRLTRLLTAKARVFGADPTRADEAARLYRALVSSSGEDTPKVMDAFETFLRDTPASDARHEDARWLAAFRAQGAPDQDRVQTALAAAAAHEAIGNRAAAVESYRSVLELDPDRLAARFALVRLLSALGDVHGALGALSQLRERCSGEVKAGASLKMGQLLAGQFDRAEEALETIAPVLEVTPDDPTATFIIERALGRPGSREHAVAILQRACEGSRTPAGAAHLLRILLDAPAGEGDPASRRVSWFTQLVSLQGERPEQGLETALRAAAEYPHEDAFWDSAEQFARALERPLPVAEAYSRAIETPMSAEMAEALGHRAVDFQEEWFEDREAVIKLLSRLYDVYRGRWAFDRLKLALNAEGRYADLFALYDRAIEVVSTESRPPLLEEAAEAAKDFARDANRAVDYLERLLTVRPGDVPALTALERLYERTGRVEKLVDLLAMHVEATADEDARERMRDRMAGLCLGIGDRAQAFGFVEEMLAMRPDSARAYELLAGVLLPEAGAAVGVELPPSIGRRAAQLLKSRYMTEGRTVDVVRVLEVELRAAESGAERIDYHRQLASLRLDSLDDAAAAFDNVTALVGLEPRAGEHRHMLADLAERLGRHEEQARVLVDASGASSDVGLKAAIAVEAASVYRDKLGELARAIDLLTGVVASQGVDPAFVLSTCRELEPLLAAENRVAERCMVLDQMAALESDRQARRAALGMVARLSAHDLGDRDRAVRAWRQRIADDPQDREALDGLVEVLDAARLFGPLIDALVARANQVDLDQARRDLGRVARIHADELGAVGDAIAAWTHVRGTFGPDDESFRELSMLLESSRRFQELAAIFDEEVRAAASAERRGWLYGKLGDICREHLGAMDRAAEGYARALLIDAADRVARNGLSAILASGDASPIALSAMAKAYVTTGEWEQAARLSQTLGSAEEVPLDIARSFWWGVGQHHRDVTKSPELAESAFTRALTFDENSGDILEALAAVQRRTPGRNLVLTMMRLSDARGGDVELLRDAAEIAIGMRDDASLRRGACEKVFELAVARWTASSSKRAQDGERSARNVAAWALRQLVQGADEASDHARAVALLGRGASLPFARKETRRMKREAAVLSVDRLADKKGALALYRELFAENQGDEVALSSLDAFAGLLDSDRLDGELVALWEQQAQLRADAKEPASAAELWSRAARLAEERLADIDRAIADHRHGAESGGLSSLEALARIHTVRGEHADAAMALERICALSPKDKLEENSQRLADAYVAAGDKGSARVRLENALGELKASERIAARLAQLYREDQAWQALADLFFSQAEQTADREQRLSYLVRALELHETKLGNVLATIPLLEQIVELDPDNVQRRLSLVDALLEANRAPDAVRILEAQIARFGSRKPKERALVHFALARALKTPKRALAELQTASRIDPGHAGILNALARNALQDGQLDLAEHTYQSLLLLYRSAQKTPSVQMQQVTRAELLLGLAEIADKKGDADRAAEFRASASSTSHSLNPPPSLSPQAS
jgi:hypothetical protein